MTDTRSVTATAVSSTPPTPLPSPSAYEAPLDPIDEPRRLRISASRDRYGDNKRIVASSAGRRCTGDWESIGQVIARLRR
jgi:hypothetical protein